MTVEPIEGESWRARLAREQAEQQVGVDAHRLCHDFPEVGPPVTIPLDIYLEFERDQSAPDTDNPPTIAPKSTP